MTHNKILSTEELLESFRAVDELDELRRDLERRRERGVATLVDGVSTSFSDGWDKPDSPLTDLLLRRVKHLAFGLGLPVAAEDFPAIAHLELYKKRDEARIRTLFPSMPADEGSAASSDDGEISVLLAAQHLRTVIDELPLADDSTSSANDGAPLGYIPTSAFNCIYRILREVLTVDLPSGHFGAAKAGENGGTLSTFVTTECARAIGRLAALFDGTASMLQEVEQITEYIELVDDATSLPETPLDQKWTEGEIGRSGIALATILRDSSSSSLLRVDTLPNALDSVSAAQSVWEGLRRFCARSLAQAEQALEDIERFRTDESLTNQLSTSAPPGAGPNSQGSKQASSSLSRFALTSTPHDFAQATILSVTRVLEELSAQATSARERPRVRRAGKEGLRHVAVILRRCLGPMRSFSRALLFERLWQVSQQNAQDRIHDLVFAADTAGSLGGDWATGPFRDVVKTALDALGKAGQFPLGPPFQVSKGGKEKRAINAHVIRALAHVAEKSEYDLSTDDVRRLALSLESDAQHENGKLSWTRVGASDHGQSSPWVSAVNLLALDRLVRCVDAQINRQVRGCFLSFSPESLSSKPRIRDLICTDLGVASMDWSERERAPVTHDLEWMRAHVLSAQGRRVKSTVSSAILYGPPGTGKTTLAESLAASCGVPLIVIAPSDLLRDGPDKIELRTELILSMLCSVTRSVILFDEFDPVIRTRKKVDPSHALTPLSFLTGNMLPRLSRLHEAARRRSFAYLLATNYLELLDDAAIRPGRFDRRVGIYNPDLASRMCRVVSQLKTAINDPDIELSDGWSERAARAVVATRGLSLATLASQDWFILPRSAGKIRASSLWSFVVLGEEEPRWPLPSGTSDWSSFGAGGEDKPAHPMALAETAELALCAWWEDAAEGCSTSWIRILEVARSDRAGVLEKYRSDVAALRASRLRGIRGSEGDSTLG
ncbi:ATP-binding protein [Engelhardtia mirabilis]|uniref:ATP-dependent zinc metalloprotease FtsH n=1 Tax=Engelhardtia mirabilis TaxID=2528011 RepID=A0A518BDP2_9BACT|nr:ATP-dependent zinc metalloprotease FtsH [Planctomycetes bacterium Pla133]QDU99427.1 ATP-dependent zinc metalloprotease FtsH [Planctomycetes bacterium Pla86]